MEKIVNGLRGGIPNDVLLGVAVGKSLVVRVHIVQVLNLFFDILQCSSAEAVGKTGETFVSNNKDPLSWVSKSNQHQFKRLWVPKKFDYRSHCEKERAVMVYSPGWSALG